MPLGSSDPIRSGMTELRFYIPFDTALVILGMFFPTNFLIWYWRIRSRTEPLGISGMGFSYGSDALPWFLVTQPSVSKHLREHRALTLTSVILVEGALLPLHWLSDTSTWRWWQSQHYQWQICVSLHTCLFQIEFVVFFQLLVLLFVQQNLVLLQQQLYRQWNGFRTCPLQRCWPIFIQTACLCTQI